MAANSFVAQSIGEFLEHLASEAPTPGGGSVAALTGALAAGLGQMACTLTLGRKKFADVEEPVRQLATRLAKTGGMLRRLMDEDAAAYSTLHTAFKLDKSDATRARQIEQAASVAAQVPLETATVSRSVLRDLAALREIGNPNLSADMEAATHLAQAARLAAAANVRANLPLLPAESAILIEKQLQELLRD
ncbi:MAG: cyclodeaminase/cyclohydrolase family protein [Planctomycetota bacterium]